MILHRNARTCPQSRRLLVDRVLVSGWSLAAAAEAAGVSERTAWKWVDRYRREGETGLEDRPSTPRRVPSRTPAEREELILLLRELRFTTPEIAETLGMPLSTVGAVVARNGLGKLPRIEAEEPANSYERPRPGELIHIDVKKLGRIGRPGHRVNGDRTTRTRGIGWEYVHVAVDDATRLAYVEVLNDEKGTTAAGFLRRAVAFFGRFGIRVERVLTDNGSCYRAVVHALACRGLGIKHLRTRPYRPRTNGKAERFIRTLTDGWAYGAVYRTSTERTAALNGWLDWYNRLRPHRSLGRIPPLTRLAEMNNVVGTNTRTDGRPPLRGRPRRPSRPTAAQDASTCRPRPTYTLCLPIGKEVRTVLWMALFVLLVIAVVGGIAISKFLFLVLVGALLVALVARRSSSH